ncbi:MAG: hypothetical protein HY823_01130 [Acidobacteria bacterium]|nr:hypothetical protein [Acidobacteriota bacterium]
MDQSEVDALLKSSGGKTKKGGSKPASAPATAKAPAASEAVAPPAPVAQTAPPPATGEVKADPEGQVIREIDAVTEVTERETNKVMDQLDLIGDLVARQQALITEILANPGSQDPSIHQAINQVMGAAKEIQGKVFEAMDLLQFQDITRQKLERIVYHLRQIHDYIVDLLGTGLKNEKPAPSISRTIVQTGTTPDERKAHADSVVEAFRMGAQGKG